MTRGGGSQDICTFTGTGVKVRVRLTPKSARDRVEGIEATAEGPALKVRVRAVPEKGKANDALAAVFADWLGVARSRVELASGATSRCKTLAIAGDAKALAAAIMAKLGGRA